MKSLITFSLVLLVPRIVFAATTPSKNCVLDDNGLESCITNSVTLPIKVRQSSPCEKMDMKCWCIKAVEYTNDVRRRHGQNKMLKVGPMNQLDNANNYAEVLGGKRFLRHQRLRAATKEIGCGRFVGGENIAYNFETGDVAKACVKQWEGSSGHLENILRDSFEEVVVGFHYESDGRVYCVQTFTMNINFGTSGSPSDTGCEPVTMGSGPKPTKLARTEPTRPTPTEPTKPAPARRTRSAPTRSTQQAASEPTVPTDGPMPGKMMTMTITEKDNHMSCRCMCRPKVN